MKTGKTTKYFSKPLFKQDIKSNWVLVLVILVIMVLMCNVINFAMSMMGKEEITDEMKDSQEVLYTHLFVMGNTNAMTGNDTYTLEDFMETKDKGDYETLFENASEAMDEEFSVSLLEDAIDVLKTSPIEMDAYVENFEYVYAMANSEGVFSGNELDLEDMMSNMLEMSGISSTLIDSMAEMDTTSLLNEMYFHVMGLLPIFILIVVVGNSLIVGQVDRGSLAYTLSTPTRRSAVAFTQALFMILVPLIMIFIVSLARIASTKILFDEVNVPKILILYLGMYLLTEAICGLCYLGSCVANRSRKALAFGGGITVWFFIASLMGLFGSDNLVTMGIGVEELGIFNKLTLISLFDINAIGTIGSGNVDESFIWKLAILAAITVVSYVAGAVKFCKKDLPL